ncbi:hypothetical protein DY000_02063102 [Brassica cretica]|uniref:Uncharacterized protein n=1 Tax=Brassica cretica TaxID=69181 RepID=A0ABQ7ASG2_BRACR|nr:hypothetical protein DY000_02063102 [Brassica cretica]
MASAVQIPFCTARTGGVLVDSEMFLERSTVSESVTSILRALDLRSRTFVAFE